jgi:hypothetical protein
MIIEKTRHAAKSSLNIQYLIPIAVVTLVTNAECTLGIHHDQSALLTVKVFFSFRNTHLRITDIIQVSIGIKRIWLAK